MLEKDVEKKLGKKLGGLWYKFVSPGNAGVPDRIAVRDGRVLFVEMKQTDGVLSPIQKAQLAKIVREGKAVHVVYGAGGAESFLAWVEKREDEEDRVYEWR